MGGRGARSTSSAKKGQFDINQESLEKKKTMLEDKLAEYAHYALPSYTGADKEVKSNKYYEFKKDYEQTRKQLNEILNKKAEAKRKLEKNNKTNNKTFVNGYGEATKRYITTATYERLQRRLERETLRRMRGR